MNFDLRWVSKPSSTKAALHSKSELYIRDEQGSLLALITPIQLINVLRSYAL